MQTLNIAQHLVFNGTGRWKLACGPTLVETLNGDLLCAWLSGGDGEPARDNCVLLSRSTDRGRTWEEAQVLGLMILPALAGHWSLRVHNRAAFVGRGVFGAAGMLVYFIVINKVGLGRGTVLANLAAVFATFAAIPLLKEWPRPAAWFAVVLATLGVLGCSTSGIPAGWEWLALLGALFGGLTFPFIRKLRQTDSNVSIKRKKRSC